MVPAATSLYHASDGAACERFLGRWTKRLAGPLIDFAAPASDGSLIDVGCGTGSLAIELAHHGSQRSIVDIDSSRPYIDYARS